MTLRPAADSKDEHTHFIYNSRAQLVGIVDAENYLTEYQYDLAGNKSAEIRYAAKINYSANETVDQIRPATQSEDKKTTYLYDGLNRLVFTTSDPDGASIYNYMRDIFGNPIITAVNINTPAQKILYNQTDSQGRVSLELSAQGGEALNEGMSLEDAIAQYAIKYTYDQAGHRTSMTDANGNKTLYYYDADGRLTYTINALGEVSETAYNSFGEVSLTRRYAARLSSLNGLIGGQATSIANLVSPLDNDSLDQRLGNNYTRRGEISAQGDGVGMQVYTYDAFGDITLNFKLIDSNTVFSESYAYDRRSLQISAARDSNTDFTSGINLATHTQYDAFGRATQITDARGHVRTMEYDRLGRIVSVTDPTNATQRTTYDAFSRALTRIDAAGHATTYSYDTANRKTTVTTPEGIQTSTVENLNGQVISVTDGNGNVTSYTYDPDGHLKTITTPTGTTTHNYDHAGQLIETIDANGIKTDYTYDAAGRMITRAIDPDGLNLLSHTRYDGVGRTVWQQDANGVWTHMDYDCIGEVITVTVDPSQTPDSNGDLVANPNGLNLTTTYTYDDRGKTLTVAEGAGTAQQKITSYEYDHLGRRIAEHIDPSGLNLTTTYTYDANDNVIAKTDATGATTRYVYSDRDELIYSIDATGAITRYDYDANGHVVQTTAYASQINLVGLALNLTLADVSALVSPSAADEINRTVYDADGRIRFSIDARNFVTQFNYDNNGNVIQRTRYTNALQGNFVSGTAPTIILADATPPPNDAYVQAAATDQTERSTYDNANRQIFSVDAAGYVTQYFYDNNGHVVKETRYANAMIGTPISNGVLQIVDSAVENGAYVVANTAADQVIRHIYDAAGLERFTIDAAGYVTQRDYDHRGQVTRLVRYATAINVADGATVANIAALLPTTPSSNDAVRQTHYDDAGRALETIDAIGTITHYDYDSAGREVDAITAYGTTSASTTRYSYDGAGRLIAQTQAYGSPIATTTRYILDALGNRVQIIDPRGVELAESDSAWAVAMREQLGYGYFDYVTWSFHTYTAAELSPSQRDELYSRYSTRQYFDGLGRIEERGIGNNYTSVAYDAFGNVVESYDGNNSVTRTYFDQNNQAVLQVDADGYVTQTSYDAFGNAIKTVRFANAVANNIDEFGDPLLTPSNPPVIVDVAPTGSNIVYVLRDSTRDQVTAAQYDHRNLKTQVTDSLGYSKTYTYDRFGNRTSYTDKSGGTTGYVYDVMGHLLAQTSPTGVVTTYQYDARGNLRSMTEAQGSLQQRTTYYQYDLANQLTDITNPNGTITHYVLDARGNIIEQHDAFGTSDERVTSHEYDALNQLVKSIDALGIVTAYQYDRAGNRIETTLAVGLPEQRTERCEYDANNRCTAEYDGEEDPTYYSYDGDGNLIRKQVGDYYGRASIYEYDGDNRLIDQYNQMGFNSGARTDYRYDAFGNIIETVQALGIVGQERHTLYAYDLDNRLIQITDPMGAITQYEYDASGNQTQITDANGGVQHNTFDSAGRLVSTLSAGGVLTVNTYDNRGNIVSTTESFADGSDARTTRYTYDILDRKTSVTDGEGFTTSTQYDVFGNQTQITSGQYLVATTDSSYDASKAARAHEQSTTFMYDAANHQRFMIDGEGNVTEYTYDAIGNRTSKTEAALYTYDANSHQLTEANSYTTEPRTTTYYYDRANRLVEVDTPEGGVTRYGYNYIGDKTDEWVERGDLTIHRTFQYDFVGRLIAVTVENAYPYGYNYGYSECGGGYGITTRYDYDAIGNLLETEYASGGNGYRTTSSEYDLDNRKVADIDGEGNRTAYTYDNLGNRTTVTDALGHTTHYYYNSANRLIGLLTPEGTYTSYAYDSAGNQVEQHQYALYVGAVDDYTPPQLITSSADRITTTQYDRTNHAISVAEPDGNRTQKTYDATGNLIHEVLFANTATPRQRSYEYDLDNRLVHFTDIDGTQTYFTWDGANNKTSEWTMSATDTNVEHGTEYYYDLDNRLIQKVVDPNGLSIAESTSYDLAGNVSSRTDANGNITYYYYDFDNRLIQTRDGSGNSTYYAYDDASNLTSVSYTPDYEQYVTTTYAYDRNGRVIAEYKPAVQIYTSNGGMTYNSPTTRYYYDAAGNKSETVQAADIVGEERYTDYIYDSNNRLVEVDDPAGSITHYQYDAFGNQTQITDANGGIQYNTFDINGRLVSTLSAGGILTVNTYDIYGNIISTTQSFADGSDARTTSYTYDILNRKTSVTDGEGFTTSIQYDDFGNQRQITIGQYLVATNDPSYDAGKAARAHTQSNTFTYDAANRMLSMTDGEGNVTEYTYDAVGNRTSKTEAANTNPRTTSYSYDGANRLIEVDTPEGGVTRYSYDFMGRKVDEWIKGDDLWTRRNFWYDDAGRLGAMTVSHEAYHSYYYYNEYSNSGYGITNYYDDDAVGNLVETEYAVNGTGYHTTSSEYDSDNRKTADIDGEGNRTTYTYDNLGNRLTATDALGHTAHYYYDSANHLIGLLTPEGTYTAYTYDSAGNQLTQRQYANFYTGTIDDFTPPQLISSSADRVTTSRYDRTNHAISVTGPDGSTTQKTYDGAGNLINEVLFANTTAPRQRSYEYDLDNRLVHFTDVDGTQTYFTWDGANNKTSERIVSATDTNAVRETRYVYDLNNRLVEQIFDPNGLNITEHTSYDLAGNVSTHTDANGNVTHYYYDFNNRLIQTVDATGNSTNYGYDDAGNRTSVSNQLGVTTYVYDKNGRVVQQRKPEILTITAGVWALATPTTQYIYDPLGNLAQTIDPMGKATTRYFDSSGRKIAELSADDVLTEWQYDAFGNAVTQTLYMTPLTDADQNISVLPAKPVGASRTTTTQYDVMGRVVRVIYPSVDVTSVSVNSDNSPTATVSNATPEERTIYDAFGNAIETIDKAGNHTYSYYDVNGRCIAKVDALGYLVEWDYDQQGNVIEQRTYAQPLNINDVQAGVRPASPTTGDVYTVSRRYDAASRLIAEYSPAVTVHDSTGADSNERILTTYTYDAAGNQVSRTTAAGTVQAATEYYYYDAASRKIAVIDDKRVLTTFAYDASGNTTQTKRFANTVASTINLASLNYKTITQFQGLVASNSSIDEETDSTWDADNNLIEQRTVGNATAGTYADLHYSYDAGGHRTWSRNQGAQMYGWGDNTGATLIEYDAMGRVARTVMPNGTSIVSEYDASGNLIYQYIGDRIQSAVIGGITMDFHDAERGSDDGHGTHGDSQFDWDFLPWSRTISFTNLPDLTNLGVGDIRIDFHLDSWTGARSNQHFSGCDRSWSFADGTKNSGNLNFIEDGEDDRRHFWPNEGPQTRTGTIQIYKIIDGEAVAIGRAVSVAFNRTSSSWTAGGGERSDSYATGSVVAKYDNNFTTTTVVTPATSIVANFKNTDGLSIAWTVSRSTSKSWVVWDTASHSGTTGYVSKVDTEIGGSAIVIPPTALSAGQTIYFRVATADAQGNVIYSREESVTIPPVVQDIQISRLGTSGVHVAVTPPTGAQNITLYYGAEGNVTTPVTLTLQADGTYTADVASIANLSQQKYRISWQDAAGNDYSTSTQKLISSGEHLAATTTLSQNIVTANGTAAYTLAVNTNISTTVAQQFSFAKIVWLDTDDANAQPVERFAAASDNHDGTTSYGFLLGSTAQGLPAGHYKISLLGVYPYDHSVAEKHILLDEFTVDLGGAIPSGPRQTLNWTVPASAPTTPEQLVLVDGANVAAQRDSSGNQLLVSAPTLTAGDHSYQVFYGQHVATQHTLTATSTAATTSGYDIAVGVNLDAAETAAIAGAGLHLSWRSASSAQGFANDAVMTANGNQFTNTVSQLASGDYELKLWYKNASGQEVIVDYQRFSAATVNLSQTGQSFIVTASETDGSVSASYDIAVATSLTNTQLTAINGKPLYLSWQQTSPAQGSVNVVSMSLNNTQYFKTLPLFVEGNYQLQLYYMDDANQQVVLDSLTISATAVGFNQSTQPLVVVANGSSSALKVSTSAVLSTTNGIYSGAQHDTSASLALTIHGTGNAAYGTVMDGRSQGYYIENQYNAANQLIATNAETGVWRTYGVDLNGNRVATYEYGTENNTTVHDSYALFDARNRKIADYGVAVAVYGDANSERLVTHHVYDALNREISQTDNAGRSLSRVYNALGSVLSETDSLQNTTQHWYDRLGNETKALDQSQQNTTYKFYNAAGELIREIDGAGNETDYVYDSFGRKTQVKLVGPTRTITSQTIGYDQADRITSTTDAMGHTTSFRYNQQGQRISEIDANGHSTNFIYDGMGRLTETEYDQNNVSISNFLVTGSTNANAHTDVHEIKRYDGYGNLVLEVDGNGHATQHIYGAFAHKSKDIDVAGVKTHYEYDQFGNLIHEYSDAGKNIWRTYDTLGRLKSVQDLGIGVTTTYEYDLAGNRVHEVTSGVVNSSDGSTHNRDITYTYDADGRITRWADSITGMHLNYQWDADGNQKRVYTDAGYASPVDHWYNYDGANRITEERNGGATGSIINGYHYNAFGNRDSWNNAGNTVSYLYDDAGRVTDAFWTNNGAWHSTWSYNNAGSTLRYQLYKNGVSQYFISNVYTNTGSMYFTQKMDGDGSDDREEYAVWTEYDADGRITTELHRSNDDADSHVLFNHYYSANGLTSLIQGSGRYVQTSNTTFAYDVDGNLIRQNMSRGDGMDRAELKTFTYNNDGQILSSFHDTGKDFNIEASEFVYANGNEVGERSAKSNVTPDVSDLVGTKDAHGQPLSNYDLHKAALKRFNVTSSAQQLSNAISHAPGQITAPGASMTESLDSGDVSSLKNISDTYPNSSFSTATVVAGDTLQSIAERVYGNASLWFVLADANGLDGSQPLVVGMQLQVPNTVKTARLDSSTHAIYSPSAIVGSNLPNLKAKPQDDGCDNIFAIIIIVIIAVVVAIYAPEFAQYVAEAFAGTTEGVAGAALYATGYVVGAAAVAAAGSIVQQGLFMAMGYQHKFSWAQVAQAAVNEGETAGLNLGVDKVASGLETAESVAKMGSYAKVADAAIHVAGNVVTQFLQNGKITSWSSVAMAGLQAYLTFDDKVDANMFDAYAKEGANSGDKILVGAAATNRDNALQSVTDMSRTLAMVSPWLNAAESYVRGKDYTVENWVGAVGQTLGVAFSEPGGNTAADSFTEAAKQAGKDLLIGGAMSLLNKNAGNTYLEHAIGQDIGTYLGSQLVSASNFDKKGYLSAEELMQQAEQNRARNAAANDANNNPFGNAPLNLSEPTIDKPVMPTLSIAPKAAQPYVPSAAVMANSTAGATTPFVFGVSDSQQTNSNLPQSLQDVVDQKPLDYSLAGSSKLDTIVSDIPNYKTDPWGYYEYFLSQTRALTSDVKDDFFARNERYTSIYTEQYSIEQQPWFGLAAMASSKVYDALSQSRLGSTAFGFADFSTGLGLVDRTALNEDLAISYKGFAEGNRRIFEDQNTAYEIYKDGGVDALRSLTEAGVFGSSKKNPYINSLVQGYEAWDRAKGYRNVGDMEGFNREADSSLRHLANFEQRVIIQPVYDQEFTVINNAGNSYTNTLRGALKSVDHEFSWPDLTKVNVLGTKISFKGIDVGDAEQRMQRINKVADAYMKVYKQPNGTQLIETWDRKRLNQ